MTRLSSVVTGLREVLGVPVHPWGGNTFPTEARERPCGLLEEVQRWRSGCLQRCQHEPRDTGANEGSFTLLGEAGLLISTACQQGAVLGAF